MYHKFPNFSGALKAKAPGPGFLRITVLRNLSPFQKSEASYQAVTPAPFRLWPPAFGTARSSPLELERLGGLSRLGAGIRSKAAPPQKNCNIAARSGPCPAVRSPPGNSWYLGLLRAVHTEQPAPPQHTYPASRVRSAYTRQRPLPRPLVTAVAATLNT